MASDNRELQLRIILDIPSIKNAYSQRIMRYVDNELFEFLAVGGSSKFSEVKIDFENQFLWFEREPLGQPRGEQLVFFMTEEMIQSLASSQGLKPEEVKLLYIAEAYTSNYHRHPKAILITERKKLLHYGKYISLDLPEFTIFDPEEAALFIDLFCKRQGKYMLYPQCFANRGLWYRYSRRAKLQQFQVAASVHAYSKNPDNPEDFIVMEMMGSIASRMVDMLKAIDEIGARYYAGSNNDTLADTIYHLNYWLTLYSGILDALAWTSLYRYNITPPNENKVSIKNKDVLEALYQKNPRLKEVIAKNQRIINLVYDARNMVVHREMLKGIRFTERQLNLSLNMIKVNGEFLAHIKALQKVVPNDLNKAGLYELPPPVGFILEPYRFVRFATKRFIDFLNLYITTLDYEEFLLQDEQLRQKIEDAAKNPSNIDDTFTMNRFLEDALGY